MQILPTSNYDGAASFFGAMGGDGGDDFAYAMRDALSSVQDGDHVSADAALAENAPEVESPYTKHTTDGITYTMGEVLFTKQELAELRLELLKEGAPAETLKNFDILADQPNGATLAQVMASLMGNLKEISLSEDDERTITAFLGQLDPTGDLAGNVLAQMRAGNGQGALGLIQGALGGLGLADSIDLDTDTAAARGKGLGLNADTMRQIAEGFGGRSSLTINAAQFDTLMNPAKNQLMLDAANADKLEAALEKTLKPIISKARSRMEKEKEAAERESRRVQQSKILIDKTVLGESREMLNETLAEAGAALDKNSLKENLSANAANALGALNAEGGKQAPAAAFGQEAGESGAKEQGGKAKDGWSELLGKVDVKPAASQGPAASAASSIVYSMLQGDVEAEGIPLQNPLAGQQAPHLPGQLASQVEQGLLTAMRDGASRLDLQLHPAELGSLAITLIARNGEVTALIRSEKSETAEMMQRQLDTIRVNLENQGVRVDKIEVQLENHQDPSQQFFDDLGQHNARQEEHTRRQELSRMRNLAALRRQDGEEGVSALAQDVHTIGQTARYAGQALHVVA